MGKLRGPLVTLLKILVVIIAFSSLQDYLLKVRKYGKADHERVCRIFYTTVMEAWLPAYRRVVTFKAPIATLLQVGSVLSMCCKILLLQGTIVALLHYFTPNFFWFLLAVFFLQMLIMITIFYVHWGYCW